MATRYARNQYHLHRSRAQRPRRTRTALVLAASLVAAGGVSVVVIPLASAAECTEVDVVVARGTGERGELGSVVGDPVFAALQRENTGVSLSSHPVDYPANLSRQSPAIGNQELVDHVTTQAAACPNQRFVLVGYSQGANVVGNSLGVSSAEALVGSEVVATIPAQTQGQIAAVMLFGNPIRKNGDSLGGDISARLLDVCADGDRICQPDGGSLQAHLSYGKNAGQAADFAANLITPGASATVIPPGTISGDPGDQSAGDQGARGQQGSQQAGRQNGQRAGGRKLPGLRPGGKAGGKLGGLKPGGAGKAGTDGPLRSRG